MDNRNKRGRESCVYASKEQVSAIVLGIGQWWHTRPVVVVVVVPFQLRRRRRRRRTCQSCEHCCPFSFIHSSIHSLHLFNWKHLHFILIAILFSWAAAAAAEREAHAHHWLDFKRKRMYVDSSALESSLHRFIILEFGCQLTIKTSVLLFCF